MLARLADHARIVNATPSDAFVTQRGSAVSDLVQKDLTLDVLASFVEIAAFGFPSVRTKAHDQAARTLYEAIHAHQPSFVDDVDATQMDLRLVASVTLGELIQSSASAPRSFYLAALLRSGTTLLPAPSEVYVAKLLKDLMEIADRSLLSGGEQLRVRQDLPLKPILGSDVASLGKSATTVLEDLVEVLKDNIKADREELNVLWWVFGGRSTRTGKRFESLRDGERAMTAATELNERMLMPPIKAASHVLRTLVPDGPEMSLSQFVGQLSKDTLLAFVGEPDQNEGESNPVLLPMTWLSGRLIASDLSAGWEPEFSKKTRFSAASTFSTARWATQLFEELVARRLGADPLNRADKENP